jgi:hypothetical protein
LDVPAAGKESEGTLKTSGFGGTLTNTRLHDIIQLICIARATCHMQVRSGTHKGLICFKDGEIVHADTGGVEGERAFYDILSWELGVFECHERPVERETIEESWDFLLMESLRRVDLSEDA